MKLSELRPCYCCGGKLKSLFYQLSIQPMFLNPAAVGQTLGLAQNFSAGSEMRGQHLALAEAMSPTPEATLTDPELETELILCQDCYLQRGLCLAELVERVENNKK